MNTHKSLFGWILRHVFTLFTVTLVFGCFVTIVCLFWFAEADAGKPPKPDPGAPLEIVTTKLVYGDQAAHFVCYPKSYLKAMSGDGGTRKDLLRECGCYLMDPSWSPDGSRIVFTAQSNYTQNKQCTLGSGMKTVGSNGKDLRLVLAGQFIDDPAWSPQPTIDDRYYIAYTVSSVDLVFQDVYLVPVDALGDPLGDPMILTNTPDTKEFCPTWSPNADRVAYIRSGNIIIRDLYTDEETIIESPVLGGMTFNLEWAKTGDQFVIAASPGTLIWVPDEEPPEYGHWEWVYDLAQIWVIDFTIEPPINTMLVDNIDFWMSNEVPSPSWSSDDSKIVYKKDDCIWVINSNGTGSPTMIADEGDYPSWRR